jgi:murein L,D-transpeptidase YcbB/YkuD
VGEGYQKKLSTQGRDFDMRMLLTMVWLWGIGSALLGNLVARSLSEEVRESLRVRLEAAGVPPRITVGGELIYASVTLPLFYERRTYEPAWSDNSGPLPQAEALVSAIRQADRQGLTPEDYHLARIEATLRELRQNQENGKPLDPRRLVDLDLLLTDAFLIYGFHLLAGRVNPETIDPEWRANRRDADLAALLQSAVETNQIEQALEGLLPPQPGYARLQEALARYRQIAARGGWVAVPEGPKMEEGERGERVLILRQRLAASGDLDEEPSSSADLFDEALQQAVQRFQNRHGLEVDGVVGPATLAALNLPVEMRVRQIELNMERWRWLPEDLGKSYILINIANFELDVVENGQKVMMMRVVVGRDYRRTPVFSDRMTYLVFSPYWHVPQNIAVQDILPAVRKDPAYLAQKNIRVFQGWGVETKEIDPTSVDWSEVGAKNLNYRFRQEPGPSNALGRVKFMFPNKFNVYLHDTPSRELFAKSERAFSSGCIRIEKALELAEYLLRSDPRWTRENILAAMDKRVEQSVPLPEPLNVHLLYWTAWSEEGGVVRFRNDIYGRDRQLDEAMREKPPRP